MPTLSKSAVFGGLPPAWAPSPLPEIQAHLAQNPAKLVVLDDDPTGTQTVHDVPVLTSWSVDGLRDEFAQPGGIFYILTNSRSLPPAEAEALNAEIAANLLQAAGDMPFHIVSRSDSTLRGHFPLEPRTLAQSLTGSFDGWLIVPFFEEGGRYTINGVHYVAEGDRLRPASETPFAQDASFGYSTAVMREWVAEKTGGAVASADVAHISLADLRQGGPNTVRDKLMSLRDGQICAVDAASYRDLEVLVLAILRAEAQGKRFLYRTAASFVRTRAGLDAHPLLTATDLSLDSGAGLVVVGSYVPKTSAQLAHLLANAAVTPLELRVDHLLSDDRSTHITDVTRQMNAALAHTQTVVLYTSRDLVTGADAETSLHIGQNVSDGLIAALDGLTQRPAFVVAKGGITSSDVATKALHVKRAIVRGQIAPGVPVWEIDATSRFPGMPYVVFPGNVGTDETLTTVIGTLVGSSSC